MEPIPLSTEIGKRKIFTSFGGFGFTAFVMPNFPLLWQLISIVFPSESSLPSQNMSIGS